LSSISSTTENTAAGLASIVAILSIVAALQKEGIIWTGKANDFVNGEEVQEAKKKMEKAEQEFQAKMAKAETAAADANKNEAHTKRMHTESRKQIKEAVEQLAREKTEVDRIRKLLRANELELKTTQQEKEHITGQFETIRSENAEHVLDMNRATKEKQVLIWEHEQHVLHQERHLERMERKMGQEAADSVQTYVAAAEAAKRGQERIKKELGEQERLNDQNATRIREVEEEKRKLHEIETANREEYREAIRQLKDDNREERREHVLLAEDGEKKMRELENTNAQLEKLGTKLDEEKDTGLETKRVLQESKTQLEVTTIRMGVLKDELARVTEEKKGISDDKKALERDIRNHKHTIEEQEDSASKREKSQRALTGQYEEKLQTERELRDANDGLRSSLKSIESTRSTLRETIENLEKKVATGNEANMSAKLQHVEQMATVQQAHFALQQRTVELELGMNQQLAVYHTALSRYAHIINYNQTPGPSEDTLALAIVGDDGQTGETLHVRRSEADTLANIMRTLNDLLGTEHMRDVLANPSSLPQFLSKQTMPPVLMLEDAKKQVDGMLMMEDAKGQTVVPTRNRNQQKRRARQKERNDKHVK